jgi:hypothetical protein
MAQPLSRNVVYRREVSMGSPRQWWRRHMALCLLLALMLIAWSLVELIFLAPVLGPLQIQLTTQAMILVFLILGPFQLAVSLARDRRHQMIDSLLASGVSPEEYLRGKFFGALRPTWVLLFALWIRWMLIEVRTNASLGQLAGLGETGMIHLHLVYGSVSFWIGSLLWVLGTLCYGAIAMAMTLRRDGAGAAMATVLLLALAVDVWGPAALQGTLSSSRGGFQDTVIGLLFGLGVAVTVLKWILYRYLFDRSVERLEDVGTE